MHLKHYGTIVSIFIIKVLILILIDNSSQILIMSFLYLYNNTIINPKIIQISAYQIKQSDIPTYTSGRKYYSTRYICIYRIFKKISLIIDYCLDIKILHCAILNLQNLIINHKAFLPVSSILRIMTPFFVYIALTFRNRITVFIC